jgi:hypothetical protein
MSSTRLEYTILRKRYTNEVLYHGNAILTS